MWGVSSASQTTVQDHQGFPGGYLDGFLVAAAVEASDGEGGPAVGTVELRAVSDPVRTAAAGAVEGWGGRVVA
jgi:hypothetical protein